VAGQYKINVVHYRYIMLVKLIHFTPNPEHAVALAARLCYSPVTIDALQEKISGDDIKGFLEKIMSLGHQSVLEHASFTFGIEGVSRVTTHQLVRHRLASFSQQSQRYVSHKERFAAITPTSIAAHPEIRERFAEQLRSIHRFYAEMIEAGIPAEDARYILPNATETKIMVTMNAREMSLEMLKLVKAVAPTIFRNAGPGCLNGPCPEGPMTCGKASETRDFYKNL
jgi:thymidylate synthase (FAD)